MLSYQAFDRLAFVSQGVQAGFEARFGSALRERSVVQYNPIDVEEIMCLSRAFPVSKQHLTCCASGRLVPEKGFQRLFNAVNRLQSEGYLFDLLDLGGWTGARISIKSGRKAASKGLRILLGLSE